MFQLILYTHSKQQATAANRLSLSSIGVELCLAQYQLEYDSIAYEHIQWEYNIRRSRMKNDHGIMYIAEFGYYQRLSWRVLT